MKREPHADEATPISRTTRTLNIPPPTHIETPDEDAGLAPVHRKASVCMGGASAR
jgi:hypothetical protein